MKHISEKGQGSIWCVEKAQEEDSEDFIVQKAKKKKYDVEERRERVQARFEDLKKQHGTQYTGPQYRFWAEALEVGLHCSVDDPPHGRMFESSTKSDSKKPNELKEAFTYLARVITGAIQTTGHKTPPLRSSPLKQLDTFRSH